MARKIVAADLTIVFCNCMRPPAADRLPDGTSSAWYTTPGEAARAVKRHVEAEDMYWLVHYVPEPSLAAFALDTHVVSVVIDGIRYGPGPPEPA